MRDSTLLFLVKKENEDIKNICLAMKKRGFGMSRYNGVGGKVEPGETTEESVVREASEEIFVQVENIEKCAELTFIFPHNQKFDQLVHVYLSEYWTGNPAESEEMNPQWFAIQDIPYTKMWPDDFFWLPKILNGDFVRARFVFGEGDIIKEQEVTVVNRVNETSSPLPTKEIAVGV